MPTHTRGKKSKLFFGWPLLDLHVFLVPGRQSKPCPTCTLADGAHLQREWHPVWRQLSDHPSRHQAGTAAVHLVARDEGPPSVVALGLPASKSRQRSRTPLVPVPSFLGSLHDPLPSCHDGFWNAGHGVCSWCQNPTIEANLASNLLDRILPRKAAFFRRRN